MKRKEDIEVLKQARPYLRSLLAFIIYLRWGKYPHDKKFAYREADEFVRDLEQEVEADNQ